MGIRQSLPYYGKKREEPYPYETRAPIGAIGLYDFRPILSFDKSEGSRRRVLSMSKISGSTQGQSRKRKFSANFEKSTLTVESILAEKNDALDAVKNFLTRTQDLREASESFAPHFDDNFKVIIFRLI